MNKVAHTYKTSWVQGSSILIKDYGAGTDTEKKNDRGSNNLKLLMVIHMVVIYECTHTVICSSAATDEI